jgi:predicted acylesterase/phospholipase RssA
MRTLPGFGPGAQGFVLVTCVGFVLLTIALHLFFRSQSKYFRCENNAHLLRATVVVLGLLSVAYIALSAVAALNAASLLELTGGFWKWFIFFVFLLSCLLLWLGHTREPEEEKHSWLQRRVGFMFSEFRSRAVFGSERRYMRFARVAVIAWVWWNLLVAPGLYGNENAQDYFKTAFDNYILERSAGKKGDDFALTVPFVIAATSLEKQQERYFLFGSEDTLDRALAPQAWLHVASDPRWAVIRNVQVSELRDAAFASGSPFPVFSAHKVPVHALHTEERLIDGGFAHNIPLDAAAALGAQKVLVISSSPLETGAPSTPCRWVSLLSVGDLTCNLPKLLPYLWERSQVEDVLSTRNMFVAVIYPTASESGWPALTDFRAAVVKDLVDAADRDQRDRIGVVESWGVPEVSRAQLFDYDLALVSQKLGDLAHEGQEEPP